jgi:NitT/TauT family transport system substrate-binding protein
MGRGGWPFVLVVALGWILSCAAPAAPAAGTGPSGGAPAAAESPAAAPPATVARAPERVVVAYFPAPTSSIVHIADERGYFREQGVDAEIVPTNSTPDAVMLLNSGQLDVYVGGTGANLYNAVARGVHLRAVVDKQRTEPDSKNTALVARRDLWDNGEIRSVADLRGRTIATVISTGGQEYYIGKILGAVGLTLDDVVLQGMPPPDQLAALANRGVDAAYLFNPGLCTAERRNLGVALRPAMNDVAVGAHGGLTYYGEHFMRDKPQAARGFMVAYIKAARDFVDAHRYGVDRAEIIPILQKYAPMPDPSFYDDCEWGRINPDGYLDRQTMEEEMLWFVKAGLLDRPVPFDQFVDESYVDYANQVLGPYRPRSQ